MADARPFQWEYRPEPVQNEDLLVQGGRPLRGSVSISGAKNAALKLLAAATLTWERCRFTNVPEIEDVRVMADTLRDLGVVVDHPEANVYEVASGDVEWLFVPLEAAAKMRASSSTRKPANGPGIGNSLQRALAVECASKPGLLWPAGARLSRACTGASLS